MPPLRLGILGCARIVRRDIARGAQLAKNVEIQAIASRDQTKANEWADEMGIPQVFDSYEALLASPDVDAVYLPLPNELHRVWALRAAAAGKHVLCEKPLGLDVADAEAIVEGCREQGVVLMEAFMWRHHPRVTKAQRLLAAGKIGDLRLIKMDFSFPILPGDWRLDAERGGGALYDLGCYGINIARLFAGDEPTDILARARWGETGVDLTTSFQLTFPGEVFGLFDCSFECPVRNRIELVGSLGTIEFPGGVLPAEESELIVTTEAGCEAIAFSQANQYAEELDFFAASVRAGELAPPAEDGLANMRVLEAVRDASRAAAASVDLVSEA